MVATEMKIDKRPIGVFDSGIGGLSVLKHVVQKLPGERFIYLGDTARVPYGNRSVDTVKLYSRQCAAFLEQHDVKMIVVACNTSSAVALDELRAHCHVPVLGVIEPAAAEAVRRTRNGHIGVVGTRATIASNAYATSIMHAATAASVAVNTATGVASGKAAGTNNVFVHSQPCPLFVPLVEEGWLDTPATRLIAEEYLRPLVANKIDTLVLGCTHYPLLSPMLRSMLPDVVLIDCGASVALEAQALNNAQEKNAQENSDENTLAHENAAAHVVSATPKAPSQTYFYLTDNTPQFQLIAQQFLGTTVNEPVRVSVDHLIGV